MCLPSRITFFYKTWPKLERWFDKKLNILVRVDADVDEEELYRMVESVLQEAMQQKDEGQCFSFRPGCKLAHILGGFFFAFLLKMYLFTFFLHSFAHQRSPSQLWSMSYPTLATLRTPSRPRPLPRTYLQSSQTKLPAPQSPPPALRGKKRQV